MGRRKGQEFKGIVSLTYAERFSNTDHLDLALVGIQFILEDLILFSKHSVGKFHPSGTDIYLARFSRPGPNPATSADRTDGSGRAPGHGRW